MIQPSQNNGHSSTVELSLRLATRTLPLAAIGPDRITLRESYDAPASDATIIMRVDGDERRWNVFLVDGLQAGSRLARIEERPDAN